MGKPGMANPVSCSSPTVGGMTDSRIVFLDVDGTIIDDHGRIAASTVEAVRTARRRGHRVFVSTGRGADQIAPAVRAIGFDGIVSAGGGFAEVDGELVVERAMPRALAERLFAYYEDTSLPYVAQTFHGSFADPVAVDRVRTAALDLEHDLHDGELSEHRAEEPPVQGFDAAPADLLDHVAKTLFIGDSPDAYDRVVGDLGGDFHIVTGTIPFMGTASGEVSAQGVNKGSTIELLYPLIGGSREQAIAIGDSPNDVEMFAAVAVGIAMANATESVRAVADEHTTSVLDDGIWNAFRRHGLV